MAFDAFIKFTKGSGVAAKDFEGESYDSAHKGWTEISSFGFGVENNLDIKSATGGAGAGKAKFKEFTISKFTDSASPALTLTCCLGGHYERCDLHIRKSGASSSSSGAPYLVYEFYMVAVQSVTWSGSDGDDVPTEEVVFEYGAIHMIYQKQNKDGSLSDPKTATWSVVLNKDTKSVS
jgi:type VI secretion system secreted protein Hcp